jgi:hypothetical protein
MGEAWESFKKSNFFLKPSIKTIATFTRSIKAKEISFRCEAVMCSPVVIVAGRGRTCLSASDEDYHVHCGLWFVDQTMDRARTNPYI